MIFNYLILILYFCLLSTGSIADNEDKKILSNGSQSESNNEFGAIDNIKVAFNNLRNQISPKINCSLLTDKCDKFFELLSITLYTNETNSINLNSIDQLDTFYESNLNSTFIFHGYALIYREVFYLEKIKDVIMQNYEKRNVFLVNWSKLGSIFYLDIVERLNFIADLLVDLISFLNKKYLTDNSQLEFIGFSLGAHLSGFISKRLNKKFPEKIVHKITGLDPAGPLFITDDINSRLDRTDAWFVKVIHTNMAFKLYAGLGTPIKSGHVDIFINGGSRQAGCIHYDETLNYDNFHLTINRYRIIENAIDNAIDKYVICDHFKAIENYIQNIKDDVDKRCENVAYQCNTYKRYLEGHCADCGTRNEKCIKVDYMDDHELEIGYRLNNGSLPYFVLTNSENILCVHHYQFKFQLENRTKIMDFNFHIDLNTENKDLKIDFHYSKIDDNLITDLKTYKNRILFPPNLNLIYSNEVYKSLIKQININYMSNLNKSIREMNSIQYCLSNSSSISQLFIKCN